MNKYLPSILAIVGASLPTLSSAAADVVSTFVQHNPTLSAWMVAALWVVYHFMPSPIQTQITTSTPPKV